MTNYRRLYHEQLKRNNELQGSLTITRANLARMQEERDDLLAGVVPVNQTIMCGIDHEYEDEG